MDFNLALAAGSGSVASGQPVQTTLSVTAASTFDQSVGFTCANLPAHARCSFAPAAMVPVYGSASSALTLSTGVAPAAAALFAAHGSASLALIGVGGLGLGTAAWRRRRPWRWPVLLLSGLLALGGVTGCSSGDGGSGGGGGGGGNPNITPSGAYAVSVTATAGAVTKTVVYTLTVQ